jgi:hypothetical protein
VDLQIALVLLMGGGAAALRWFRNRKSVALERRAEVIRSVGRASHVTQQLSAGIWPPHAWRTNP